METIKPTAMNVRHCRLIPLLLFTTLSFCSCDDLLFNVPSVEDADYFSKLIARSENAKGDKVFFFGEIGKDSLKVTQLYLQYKDGSGIQVFSCYGKDLGINPSWLGNDTLIVRCPKDTQFDDKKTEIPKANNKVVVIYKD